MDLRRRLIEHVQSRRARSRSERVFARHESVLVACSGGPDSIALLHLLHELADDLRITLAGVVHLDHDLRPESAEEAEFVARVANELDLSLWSERWEVRLESGRSLEESARNARLDLFTRVAREAGADVVVTGHHAEDQAETVLYRMIRGTGVAGLAAIRQRRELADGVQLVRPLLPFRRAALRAYLESSGHEWCEDPTNLDGNDRARIRNKVLPVIREVLERDPVPPLARLAEFAQHMERINSRDGVAELVDAFRDPELPGLGLKDGWHHLPSHLWIDLFRAAFQAVDEDAYGHRALAQLFRQAQRLSLERPEHRRRLDEVFIDLVAGASPETSRLPVEPRVVSTGMRLPWWPGTIGVRVEPMSPGPFIERLQRTDGTLELLDAASVRLPLTVRARSRGDRFQPLGFQSEARLTHVWQRRGVPARKRGRLPVVLDQRGIVWAAGAGIAQRVAVRDDTTELLMLDARPESEAGRPS